MASIKEFCKQLEGLDAVSSYLLVTTDGRVVTYTIADPDQTSSLITLALLAAEKIGGDLEAGRLKSMSLGLSEEIGLVVFSLGKWILGVQKQVHSNNIDLYKQVEGVINNFRNA